MENVKKSFVVYFETIETTDELSNEEAGILFKTMLAKVNGREYNIEDRTLRLVFKPIAKTIDRELKKYENKIQERSNSGRTGNLKRWNLDLYEDFKKGKITLEEAEEIAKSRKKSLSDNSIAKVADNDNGNENASVNENLNESDSVSDPVAESDKSLKLYTEERFLKRWKDAKMHYEKKETSISKLKDEDLPLFEDLVKKYSEKSFDQALTGFFKQDGVYAQAKIQPSHFLKNFELYLDCFRNKENLFGKNSRGNANENKKNASDLIPIGGAPKRF